jgi:hypothetical protein
MAKRNLSSTPASKTEKTAVPEHLFLLDIPAEHPQMDPDPRFHFALAIRHLGDQINNLEAVEQLAAIEEENRTVTAMSYGLTAVLAKIKDIYDHLDETNKLIKPWPADGKGGAE